MQDVNSAARSMELARGGGGYGYHRYVDCNSALAVIGFILFVDILRDFIETIIEKEGGGGGGGGGARKRRWASDGEVSANFWIPREEGEEEPDVLEFVSEDGPKHLFRSLPNILAPVLDGWLKQNKTKHHTQCVQQSICQANFVLARDYGAAGRIIATLLSNVASHAFRGSEEEGLLEATLRAARTGRRRSHCLQAYPGCHDRSTL
ncbi:uncharacterized protein LOC135198340 [Macrobrachium nipponense]|uniref:uncharacterized protein LOC135198340 n=1 Tax=Macrobrachium nipponense TaxID=159736 RepID=UPI0030C8CC66